MLSVMQMASGPDTRMMPMAPPGAVAMAQMVSWVIVAMIFLQMYVKFFSFGQTDGCTDEKSWSERSVCDFRRPSVFIIRKLYVLLRTYGIHWCSTAALTVVILLFFCRNLLLLGLALCRMLYWFRSLFAMYHICKRFVTVVRLGKDLGRKSIDYK